MPVKTIIVISAGVMVLSFIFSYFDPDVSDENIEPQLENVDLAVCILSARENFELRDAIRDTWMSDFQKQGFEKNITVLPKFIVGSKSCEVHPDYRLSPYGCQEWNFTFPENAFGELAAFAISPGIGYSNICAVNSVTFLVMHDIVIKRVGIPESFPFDQDDDIQVVLYDKATEEEISRSRFIQSHKGNHFQGFKYRPMEELVLPKGYQFILTVERASFDNLPLVVENFENDKSTPITLEETHHGLLYVKSVTKVASSGQRFSQTGCSPLMSLMFSIQDTTPLGVLMERKATRTRQWLEESSIVSTRLAHELAQHEDIVVVDLLDTYRMLPRKLLLCHQWMFDNYKSRFVMKTDDDVYVRVNQILLGLERMDDSRPLWWGSFRRDWQVNRHGKWQDDRYSAHVYPEFACGSGNVMSAPLHRLIVHNMDSLQMFQGEDVSMGIWLSPFDLTHIYDPRWRCDKTCLRDMVALPQLDVDAIHWHRNNSVVCNNPCQSC